MLPIQKLEAIRRRCEEIDQLLCDPATSADRNRLQELNRERAQVGTIVTAFDQWADLGRRIREDQEALDDPELGPLAREEIPSLEIPTGAPIVYDFDADMTPGERHYLKDR